jgi:hypothetical protein
VWPRDLPLPRANTMCRAARRWRGDERPVSRRVDPVLRPCRGTGRGPCEATEVAALGTRAAPWRSPRENGTTKTTTVQASRGCRAPK